MKHLTLGSRKTLHHGDAGLSFEKKLAIIIIAMALALGINVWLVHSNYDSGVTDWEKPHSYLFTR